MPETLAFITTSRVSEILGVSEQSVRTWCRLGLIPATRPAGTRKWLIVEDDFRTWLQGGAGQRVSTFLDPAHRSTVTEDELLADAEEALRRPSRSNTVQRRRPSSSASTKRSA